MSINIATENMKTAKHIINSANTVNCEWDIIVPDSKPDIGTILKADAFASVTSKEIMQDRAVINGVVKINILYIPQDDKSVVKGIETSQNFNNVMELKGLKQNMHFDLCCYMQKISTNIINSRKINILCNIGLEADVQDESEMDFVTNIDCDSVQSLSKELKTYKTLCESENEFTIREELEVPMGKPSLSEILKVDVNMLNKDTKAINNKVIVKGDILVASLYNGDIEDNTLQYMEHEIPFTEILDVMGIREDTECDTDFIIQNINYFSKEDADGQRRYLCVEIVVKVVNKSYENVALNAVVDAYSTKYQMDMEKCDYSVDEIVCEFKTQFLMKEEVHFEEIARIAKIYNFSSEPEIRNIEVMDGKIKVEGTIKTSLIYATSDYEDPICAISNGIPFSNIIECADAKVGLKCEAKVDVLHSGYNILSDYDIEVRATLSFKARLKSTSNNNLIKSINIDEDKTYKKQRSSVVIYFCSENESLWDIAKKYKTTVEDIIDINGLNPDKTIVSNMQILIP